MGEACIFCDPREELVLHKSDRGLAMVYPKPARPGHVVVAVRPHKPFLQDVSEEEAQSVFGLANRLAQEIVPAYGAEKVYVLAIGDSDRHFHVHLLPKLPDDPNLGPTIFGPGGWVPQVGKPFEGSELSAFVERIREQLG